MSVLAGFLPLAVLAALGWLVLRLIGAAKRSVRVDPAVAVRQLIIYGLSFVTMLIGVNGITSVYSELADRSDSSANAALAQGLAMVAIGIPAFAILLSVIDRRLRSDRLEREGLIWAAYLNLTLVVTLIPSMVFTARVISDGLDSGIYAKVDGSDVVAMVAWGSLWALHWGVLRHRHGVVGDLHYATGSVIGGATMAAGMVGLIYIGFDWLYTELANDTVLERAGPTTESWIATFAVGVVVWIWFWLARYRNAPRTESWYVTAIPVGALAGFAAAIGSAAAAGYQVLVWFFGNPNSEDAVRHFDQSPFVAALFLTGSLTWFYSRGLIGSEGVRNEPQRVYDYTLTGAALLAGAVGLVMLLSGLFVPSKTDANDVIAGLMAVAIGGPLWLYYWRAIARHVRVDRLAELRSPLRRVYVYLVVGVSAIAVLVSGLLGLEGFFEDVLDGVVSTDTLSDNRFSIATLIVVIGVSWYHFVVLRAERSDYEEPPPPPRPRTRRAIVLGGRETEELSALGSLAGLRVEYLHRADEPDRPVGDPSQLVERMAANAENDLLVVIGANGADIIALQPTTEND